MKTLNANELKEHFRNHMNIDVVEIDGKAYACTRWNGEQWNDCWQVDEKNYKPVNDCQISIDYDKSTYQVEDENNNKRVCKLQEMQENECIIQGADEFYKTI